MDAQAVATFLAALQRDNPHIAWLPEELEQIYEEVLSEGRLSLTPWGLRHDVGRKSLEHTPLRILPDEIELIDGLKELDIQNNELVELPVTISKLAALQKVNVKSNELPLLPQKLEALKTLVQLDIGYNKLRELPEWLQDYTQLEQLGIARSSVGSLPTWLTNFKNLTHLNIASNELKTLPEWLGQLTALQSLHLSNNQLTALPESLGQLTALQRLDLSSNQLTALPEALGKLTNLQRLDLSNNQLTALPESLGQLTALQQLDLSNNQLTALPESLGQLTALQSLNLSRNQLTILPESLGQLTALQQLDLSRNQLTTLPESLGQLANLKELDLLDNLLTRLPKNLFFLKNLRKLYLGNNKLIQVPAAITTLAFLERLDLAKNQITALPVNLAELKHLETLQLKNNQLKTLPPKLDQLARLRQLDLSGNPLLIPPEILDKPSNVKTILEYYYQPRRAMAEAKVVLVGQGGVGKTSLIRQMIDGDFNPNENKTEGIQIRHWPIHDAAGQQYRCNIWDFGGQEIMHATHQFFMTQRTLYVLVLDARSSDEDNRLEYWLKLIESFGGDSPIIIVGNKTDQHPFSPDRRALQRKYPQIRAFYPTSCERGDGLAALRAALPAHVLDLPHVHDQIPITWFDVKQRLEQLERDHIPFDSYIELCEQAGISYGWEQQQLIRFLHDLGAVLNFRDDPRLEETNVLRPDWVTQAVYAILNEPSLTTQHHGVLDCRQLGDILDNKRYPRRKHYFIIEMMRKFELCFYLDDNTQQRVLIPDLLPPEEPDTGEWDDVLAFEYHYDVLPGSVISRFMVRMEHRIDAHTYWRNGVVLRQPEDGNRALVRADREARQIIIWVAGPPATRRRFLSEMRSQFEAIHRSIKKLTPQQVVPIPGHPAISEDYDYLLQLEQMGEQTFIPRGLRERIAIRQVLDGIEAPQQRQERQITAMLDKQLKGEQMEHMRDFSLGALQSLAQTYRSNLATLELQIAQHGLQPPTHLITQRDESKRRLELLEQLIAERGPSMH